MAYLSHQDVSGDCYTNIGDSYRKHLPSNWPNASLPLGGIWPYLATAFYLVELFFTPSPVEKAQCSCVTQETFIKLDYAWLGHTKIRFS